MYDPMEMAYPAAQQPYPDSFWASTLKTPHIAETLNQDVESDVAIIGAGYTGLSTALHLVRDYGVSVTVLEANQVGWGCSGRNAGFVLPGTGRLSFQDLQRRFGDDTAKATYQEYQDAINTVSELISHYNIDCERIDGGYLKLAHTPAKTTALFEHARHLQDTCQENVQCLTQEEVEDRLLRNVSQYGGIYFPDVYALNPLKLIHGYASSAAEVGARIYTNTPVTASRFEAGHHHLHTATGHKVRARQLIIASNGYSGLASHPQVQQRYFPVMSSVLVTPPLSTEQLAALGMHPGLMAMDTRDLKYYYRLLPDNRLLFGGRGAIRGKDADTPSARHHLLKGLHQTFPALKGMDCAYFWSGWVSVSLDNYPRIWRDEQRNLAYAMGYCGAGVSFASQAGKRLAQRVMGAHDLPSLPFFDSPLKRFPLPGLRRLALRAFYQFAQWRDR
ncbi:FAD-binding oxidoreductase [Aestuariibacter halophilus]|uniref:FAD-binding oxidoreductase n=1 Tax=Fluctibacter halophilus TaxID=226011 RepID=A0ABS8GB67_9ALTE|nr:FAD-dependent oxidoreductase [Aestuariibacter halophilus]MCC2617441.1 FAD-binding oxidoreductase [Aestuariibacter halophilus]